MNVGIIGCGWLGRPLADSLSHTHNVTCYKRETPASDPFWNNTLFIIAINTKDNYLQTIKTINTYADKDASIILCSSTSVYKEFNCVVNEDTHITTKTLQKEVEEYLLSYRARSTILRLGGLMGDDRVAGRWKKVSTFSDGPVNYIHKDDVIAIISKLIEQENSQEIFNLVAPQHPLRSQVHKANAKRFNLPLGTFEGKTARIVKSDKIVQHLDYSFIYPDPLKFWG